MSILTTGQQVRDTYEVERLLGEGAFAEVYRVRHRFMGRQAMKVFKAVGGTRAEIEHDLAEALLLSRLKHPNIVEVYDANVLETDKGQFSYFTMTYVGGGTLHEHCRSLGNAYMPVGQVVDVIRQLCRGLAIAHSASPPIVHRDIKPHNILVRHAPEGLQVLLSDFGLAKAVNPLTLMLSAKGTLGFKPPESLLNVDSCAADVWAVGTTLYLLLTQKMPFPHLDDRDVADASRWLTGMRPASTFNIEVDAGLDAIVDRCLATRPADRYPDAMALLADLATWQPGRSSAPIPGASPKRADAPPLSAGAQAALDEALQLARDPMRLGAAADLLDTAIGRFPELRERCAGHLSLWRRGIAHAPAKPRPTVAPRSEQP